MLKNVSLLTLAIVLLSAAQIVIKIRFNKAHGAVPFEIGKTAGYVQQIIKDPYLWIAGFMLLGAAVLWYAMISRMSLGVAFTFAALSYPLVMLGSYWFLGETFAVPQIFGCALIVSGLTLIALYS